MAGITLKGVGKVYAGGTRAVGGVDIEIADGEFLVLVGPSGCGKSTLLRMIAGLETISEGEVSIGGRVVNEVEPADRDIAMVFQNYALYPHMTVRQNLAYGLKNRRTPAPEIARRVDEAAQLLQIGPYLDRKPRALSGGQRQRVAMGRAIVREPAVFLFDEPLSNLDAALRVNMRLEISELHQTLKTTMIYVTHDQVEAMTMADKIVVLQAGKIEQVGSPLDLYRAPANRFVAGFIGSPRMNFVGGAEAAKHGAHEIGIRPEHIAVSREAGDWAGTVGVSEHLGSDTFLHVHTEHGTINLRAGGDVGLYHGDKVFLTPDATQIHRFDAAGLAL